LHPQKINQKIKLYNMKRILLAIVSIFLAHASFSQWTSMGNGPGGTIRALCVHNDSLFAAGDFNGYVKKWDPSTNSWYTVGSLSATSVRALISYNGSLYAGGQFNSGGAVNVARLSGNTWNPVGEGLTGGSGVNCFYNWNGTLFAGGSFTTPASRAAKWNGSSWVQAGASAPTHCSANVSAMAAFEGYLYVGGQGTQPNMERLTSGNTWDNTWSNALDAANDGPDLTVNALDVFPISNVSNLTLFIGGAFSQKMSTYTSAGGFGVPLNPFTGTDVNAIIHSPNVSTGYIFAGGTFTANSVSNVARKKFNLPWELPTTAPNVGSDVKALCFYKGYLVAGGSFTSPFSNVTRTATTVGLDEISDNLIVNTCFPNPVTKSATLKLQTKEDLKQPELKMLDVNGNEIAAGISLSLFDRAHNQVEFQIDRHGLASGIYYYLVVDEQRQVATGKLIVE
jgi:hypothetical protein